MGKNAKKRKSSASQFLDLDVNVGQRIDNENTELVIGTKVKISEPSNRYYQYIFSTLDFQKIKLTDLSHLVDLEGADTKVSGIIIMASGESIAIVRRIDGLPFYENCLKIYVDRNKVIDSGELKIVSNKF
ncbi:hypothetical protein [Allomuricauda sp. d1]|uniref:hypothetical protein n=1 Tax=Allomuricauda sp. d1 TaxID=3136725 RepID=UPI0031D670B5